jgi:predicted RNase H-like nuclease (RuvC/YqgF family)
MTSSQILTVLGIGLTLLVAFAGSIGTWAALRVGRNTSVLSNYKQAAESAQAVAASLKAEVEQLRAELAEAKDERTREQSEWSTKNASMESRIAILQDLATGHTVLEALAAQLENSLVTKVTGLRQDMLREFETTRAVIGKAQ